MERRKGTRTVGGHGGSPEGSRQWQHGVTPLALRWPWLPHIWVCDAALRAANIRTTRCRSVVQKSHGVDHADQQQRLILTGAQQRNTLGGGNGKLRTSTTARLQPRAFQAQIRRYCSMQCILMHTGTLSCMWHTRRPAASCSSVFPIDIDSALNRTHRHTVHTASAPPEALRLPPLAGHASLAQALTNCRLRCPCRLQA